MKPLHLIHLKPLHPTYLKPLHPTPGAMPHAPSYFATTLDPEPWILSPQLLIPQFSTHQAAEMAKVGARPFEISKRSPPTLVVLGSEPTALVVVSDRDIGAGARDIVMDCVVNSTRCGSDM